MVQIKVFVYLQCNKHNNMRTKQVKPLMKHFREQPKVIREVATWVGIFAVCGAVLFLSAILQGCSVQRESTSNGKAVIITTDTTYIYHGGTVKFPKTK